MVKIYSVNFVRELSGEKNRMPDDFVFKQNLPAKPRPEFVISRSKTGEVLSIYSDDIWDFRPYLGAGDSGNARMIFNFCKGSLREDSKWIMFILLYVANSQRGLGLSISTLMGYLKVIRATSGFCEKHQINIKELFDSEKQMTKFINSLKTRNLLHNLSSVLSHLLSIPSEVSGFKISVLTKYEVLKLKLNNTGQNNQHPVIPPKVFSGLISELNFFIDLIYEQKDDLFAFLDQIMSSEKFARSASMQCKLKLRKKDFGPHFPEASEMYNLSELFKNYEITNLPKFSIFLIRLQHAARILIHIYTGMRHSEALSLMLDSLSQANSDGLKVYKLSGQTSKLVGQKKNVSWVTSKEILKSYEIAEQLSQRVGSHIGIDRDKTPIFISLAYLGINNKFVYDGVKINRGITSAKNEEIYNYLDNSKFEITGDDLDLLEKINPFRAWEAEAAFKKGSIWRFTTHQFRRSLAFYIAQSGNVSLPSLKRQLKHLNREMSIYYSQKGEALNEEFDIDEHISHLIRREKPEFDAISYLNNVILSNETLYGVHGSFVEKNLKGQFSKLTLSESKSELVKQFQKGEIAYKETALGACTTIDPCNKRVLRSIVGCIKCDRAVLKASKLERVIEKQFLFVEELRKIDSDSIELRTEEEDLKELVNLKSRMEGNE